MTSNRAVLFVDGNNWYHGLKSAGVRDQLQLNHAKIAGKLVGTRTWVATRYYIGQVPNAGNTRLYADQRRLFDRLRSTDPRISIFLGRLERREAHNEAAHELAEYLANLDVTIDRSVYQHLVDLAKRHQRSSVMVEKAVDVMLAVDLVVMAERDEFDTAYVLSADGDFTHAVETVRRHEKKVFAVSAQNGAQLARAVNSFIRVDAGWFSDCY